MALRRPSSLSLNGSWQLIGRNPRDEATLSLKGTVPGHVHPDLLRQGLLPDPFWRDNADQCQWVEQWEWTYQRSFDLPAGAEEHQAVLEFSGIDTFASIELNGKLLGRTSNMFVPVRFQVGALLRLRGNILRVCIDPIWRHVADKPSDADCAFENHERLHVRRLQCTFHWDWVHRFVSAGLWRGVTLHFHKQARIADLFASTISIQPASDWPTSRTATSARLRVRLSVEREAEDPLTVDLRMTAPEGGIIWQTIRQVDDKEMVVQIEKPQLWWPNGLGGQPLHTLGATLRNAELEELDHQEITLGIRTVKIRRDLDAPGSDEEKRTRELRAVRPKEEIRNSTDPGESFTLLVNGEPVFLKGGNWVPADPWPSRITPEHYERLVGLAAEANLNCLRVWGGGIYELPDFWAACNRLGILVCHDFQMACGQYPEQEPAFMEGLRIEAPAVIRQLRNHPALAWWIGDNENRMKFDFDDPSSPGTRVVNEAIRPALLELDPDRPLALSSPFGGRPNNCLTIGDCHQSAFAIDQAGLNRDWRGYRNWFSDAIGRLNTECITAGVPTLRSIRRFLAEEDIADPQSPMWYFHTKDNPYTDTRIFDALRISGERLLGPSENPSEFVAKLGYLQVEFARLTLEAARRWKGYNWGLLFWMFNDCWPATGWSFVDYYGMPKPAWFALKRACQPVIGSIEENAGNFRFWVCNDRLDPFVGAVSVKIQPWSGSSQTLRQLPVTVSANASACCLEISKTELPPEFHEKRAVLVMEIMVGDQRADRAWYFSGLPSEMAPPPVRLEAELEMTQPGRGEVVLRSPGYARVVTIDTELDVADNYFDLLPGETRRIGWRAQSECNQAIALTCWNAAGEPIQVKHPL